MVNNSRRTRIALLALATLLLSSPALAVTYKKSTVVDFDGATVEGKSRKPFSAYVSERALAASQDLSAWEPDYKKDFDLSRRHWESKQ